MIDRARVWSTLCMPLAVALLAAASVAAAAPTPSTVSASGWAFDFGGSGSVAGATVHVVEDPTLRATVREDGRWEIAGLVPGSSATFALDAPGRFPIQTATLTVPDDGLERVAFQSPSIDTVEALAGVIGEPVRPDRCQIASTVTRRGYALDRPGPDGTHGEPGATVAITPTPLSRSSAIYFNLNTATVIWPDRALHRTTADGGVLFANVTPGEYVLRATKPGAEIEPITVRCTAGVLTNAAPPHGLQVTAGGLGPTDTVPFGPTDPTTTSTPSTPVDPSTSDGLALPGATPIAGEAAPVSGAPTFTG